MQDISGLVVARWSISVVIQLEPLVKVVAHPLVVAVALGLLSPMLLASEEDREQGCTECREEVDSAQIEHFAIDGDESELPETVYLTLD